MVYGSLISFTVPIPIVFLPIVFPPIVFPYKCQYTCYDIETDRVVYSRVTIRVHSYRNEIKMPIGISIILMVYPS